MTATPQKPIGYVTSGEVGPFREIVGLLTRHRTLTWEMAKRELTDRYSGQVFGPLWTIVHPLLMIGLYLFVFVVVFKQRIGGTYDLPLDYAAYVLAGLIPWLTFQEVMSKSCQAITSNAALVQQVVFPLEILPVKSVIVSVLTQLFSTMIVVIYLLLRHGFLHTTILLVPFLIAAQVLAMIGVGYLLAAIGVFFRDVKDFVQIFNVAGIYLVPIFYLPEWTPAIFKPVLYFNPFSYLIWCYQDAIYFGRFEHPWAWPLVGAMSISVFVFGYAVFRRLKPIFGQAL